MTPRSSLVPQQGSPSGRTNFSFKKDFVKESMVVLGPERTFKLRNQFDPHGLMASNEDSATRHRSLLSPDPLRSLSVRYSLRIYSNYYYYSNCNFLLSLLLFFTACNFKFSHIKVGNLFISW